MDTREEKELRRAEASYKLEANVPGLWAEADLQVLPDSQPVRLEAEILQSAPLPISFRERSRVATWKADAGKIQNQSYEDGIASATWLPPARSGVINVQAEAWVALQSLRPSADSTPAIFYKRVDFRFLSPVSSTAMIGGFLDGYELGRYPDPHDPNLHLQFKIESEWHLLHPEKYRRPDFFYRIDRETKGLRISPHLTLDHFAIDFPWKSLGMPQFIALDMNLVEKLEDLIDLIKKDGRIRITGLTPIYGFRPPAFNLGTIEEDPDNTLKVPFSMHQFGKALDFIIDEDGDLILDDLNGDGIHDMRDAAEIMHYVNILDRQYRAGERWEKVGGAGLYAFHDFQGRVQTPYVHVDTRGFQRENQTLIRWPREWPDASPIDWGGM